MSFCGFYTHKVTVRAPMWWSDGTWLDDGDRGGAKGWPGVARDGHGHHNLGSTTPVTKLTG